MEKILMFFRGKLGKFKELWLMTKWTLLFVLLGVMSTNASVYSQTEQQISLSMKDTYLKDVLWAIERQTTFVFMYNQEDLDKVGKISVNIKAADIEKILKECLKGTGLTYVIEDAVIVLKPVRDNEKKKEIRIAGRVTDEEKQPLPGVTVRVKGINLGTATNTEGKYSLTLPEMKEIVLVYSFVGMITQEVKYAGKDTINVVLKEDKVKMDEVVVTGYMNVRKESFTGNVTTVTKDQLMKTNNRNVIAALQVFDPSFRIKENNIWGSDPNSLPEFTIRGESSIEINKGLAAEVNRRTQRTNLKDNPNLPIFILDGFQVDVQKIYDMDMNRIESMTILKDAAATAMYGSQAANGVVVVTTVAPKPGEMRITYNLSGGADFPDLSDYNLCNAKEMLEVETLAGQYIGDELNSQAWCDEQYHLRLNNILRGIDTDWMSKPLRNVFNHTHSLNIQGGEESIRYSLDLSYDSNNGVMKGSYRSRVGAGLTLDYRPKKWLQMLNSISYNKTKSENSPYGDFSQYTRLKPYVELYDEDGQMLKSVSVGGYSADNPLYRVYNLNSFDGRASDDDITNNFNVNMYFLDGFQFKGSFSVRKQTGKSKTFTDPRDIAMGGATEEDRGVLSISNTSSWNWSAKAMFYYNNTFAKKHFLNVTFGVDLSEDKSESTSSSFTGFGLSNAYSPVYAAKQPDKSNVSENKNRKVGILGSVNYSYNDVYLFDGSFRFDASSKFGDDKQWAPFWSVGAGINFHNYAFLKDHWLITMLKLRGSYGSTGNVSFPSSMATTTYKIDSDTWYFTGPAAGLLALGNPKLTWEKTNTLDVGLNMGFFNDLISLSFTYYCKKTTDLIDNINVRKSSGFTSYSVNAGGVKNEGIELNLNATLFRNKDWMVAVSATLGHNKNIITELGEDVKAYNAAILKEWENLKNISTKNEEYVEVLSSPVILYYEGASKSAIYAVRSDGIDPANGKERFIKKNGMPTYTWDANDQVVVGDNNPDAQGSVGLNVSWKGFYINTSFLYQWGAQAYNETLLNKVENARIFDQNVDKRVLTQRWVNPGDRTPFYDMGNNTQTQVTSRFVQDYNFFKFSGLSVGYDFNTALISKYRLSILSIRFNMNDVFRLSTVKEERGTSYPFSRNYSFTLSIGI